jgi:hypothetical protein
VPEKRLKSLLDKAVFYCLLLALSSTSLFAQPLEPALESIPRPGETFLVEAQAGIGPQAQHRSEWLPVFVKVKNLDSRPLEARLWAVVGKGQYRQGEFRAYKDIFVSPQSTKEFRLCLFTGPWIHQVEIFLQKRRTLTRCATVDISNLSDTPLVLVLSRSSAPILPPGLYASSRQRRRQAVVVQNPPPETLPDTWFGYGSGSVDVLILVDYDFHQLRPQQLEAIRNWVKCSGRVVISSADPTWLRSPFIQELIKLDIKGQIEVEGLPALESKFGSFEVKTKFMLTDARPRSRSWRLPGVNHSGVELVQEAPSGFGRAYFLAFDVSRTPFPGWQGGADFWQAVFDHFGIYHHYSPPDSRLNRSVRSALSGGLLRLPSIKVIGLMVALYLLTVGPANYIFLKRKNKLVYSVYTIPTIVVIFLVFILTLGFWTKGVSTEAHKISFVQALPGTSLFRESTYFTILSGTSGKYDINFDGKCSSVVLYADERELATSSITLCQEDNWTIKDFGLSIWEQGYFITDTIKETSGRVHLARKESDVEVTNLTGFNLKAALFLDKGRVYEIGDLANGGNKTITLKRSAPQFDEGYLLKWLAGKDKSAVALAGREGDGSPFVESVIDFVNMDFFKKYRSGQALVAILEEAPAPIRISGKKNFDKEITFFLALLPEQP